MVWPVVLILAHKFGVKRTHMRNATFVLALASALEMALLFNPDADPSRVYYGTDTRASACSSAHGLLSYGHRTSLARTTRSTWTATCGWRSTPWAASRL